MLAVARFLDKFQTKPETPQSRLTWVALASVLCLTTSDADGTVDVRLDRFGSLRCRPQDIRLNLAFTLSVALYFCLAPFLGWFLDAAGPRITVTCGTLLYLVGVALYVFAPHEGIGVVPAQICMGLGGPMVWQGLMVVSHIIPDKIATISTIISTSFDASMVIFSIFSLFYHKFSVSTSLLFGSLFALVSMIGFYFVLRWPVGLGPHSSFEELCTHLVMGTYELSGSKAAIGADMAPTIFSPKLRRVKLPTALKSQSHGSDFGPDDMRIHLKNKKRTTPASLPSSPINPVESRNSRGGENIIISRSNSTFGSPKLQEPMSTDAHTISTNVTPSNSNTGSSNLQETIVLQEPVVSANASPTVLPRIVNLQLDQDLQLNASNRNRHILEGTAVASPNQDSQTGSNPEVSQHADYSHAVYGHVDLKDQLKLPEFYLWAAYHICYATWQGIYFGTVERRVAAILPDSSAAIFYVNLFGWILSAFFIISPPLGSFIEKAGVVWSYISVHILLLIWSSSLLFDHIYVQVFGFALFGLSRAIYWSVLFVYVEIVYVSMILPHLIVRLHFFRFGYEHYGRLYGIVQILVGLLSFLQYPLTDIVLRRFNGDWFFSNLFVLFTFLLLSVFPGFIFTRRHKLQASTPPEAFPSS